MNTGPTGTTGRPTRLDALLPAAAREHPHRPAVRDGDRVSTYAELDARVRALAAALTDAGVGEGDHVGVYQHRGLDAVAVIHALVRLGAVAAPLEVSDPVERTARMADAGLAFLVASPGTAAAADRVRAHARCAAAGPLREADGFPVVPLDTPDAPSPRTPGGGYLLFTSGSTGWPKGVLLSQGNVLHFVDWAVGELGIGPGDRIGAQASLTFDLSTLDVFGAALAGACACVMPEEYKAFPRDAVDWLNRERITVLYAVPTLYTAMLERGGIEDRPPPGLRRAVFAGEAFPHGALRRYTGLLGGAVFYNLYGPTETNVCTFQRLPPDWTEREGTPIGTALPGTRVELVDDSGAVVPDEGEIAVAGPSVLRGYLDGRRLHPATVPLVCGDGLTRQAYMTGDLARRDTRGRLHLLGRRDHQVKRRGYRIDLGEIETVAGGLAQVRACAATWTPGGPGGAHIVLHVVAESPEPEAERSVRSALPVSMIPDQIVFTGALPLNSRGKIDRQALAAVPTTRK